MEQQTPSTFEPDLLARAQRGDLAAFGELVTLHHRRVRGYIGSYLGWPDEVDDLAQEIFIDAFRTLETFRGDAPLVLWLLGIARHRVLTHLRTGNRARRKLEGLVMRELCAQATRESLEAQEAMLTALRQCVAGLPEHSATLVIRHYFEGQTLAAIAAERGQKDSALRVALLRVRQALRQCVQRRISLEPTP